MSFQLVSPSLEEPLAVYHESNFHDERVVGVGVTVIISIFKRRGSVYTLAGGLQGGLVEFDPITRFCAEEHRARVGGRATARHLHGKIERAVRCLTVKVSAESAGAVASTMFFQSLTT